jgi:16S rRNA processing protein RimM
LGGWAGDGDTMKRILLGAIASAHGIKGEVLVKTFTGDPAAVADYGPLTDDAGGYPLTLRIVRVTPKGVIARVDGAPDRTAAERLKGRQLYVERSRLPPADADNFYHEDLIGLAAVAPDGRPVGTIVAVQNYGAGDLLEVRQTGAATTDLVPFTKAHVPSLDIAGGRLTLVMPSFSDDDAPREEEPPR